ncbi:CotH kinase family protein [Gammaproteobacteria bacterium]|nr:CotH kinase family protein [Gammaproteobacteria bacterium]
MSGTEKITKQKLRGNKSRTFAWLKILFKYSAYSIFSSIIVLSLLNTFLFTQNLKTLVNKVEDRFFGNHYYRISTIDDLQQFFISFIEGFTTKSNFIKMHIKIDEREISSILFESRMSKTENLNIKRLYHDAQLSIKQDEVKQDFRVKIRGKGDREFHFYNIDSMSYRVNIKGDDRFSGLEEFSIQRPILRNYTWEYLVAEIVKNENLITLLTKPVDFMINGQYRGIYSMEEVPSSETLRRNKRPNGPIYSLNENFGHHIDSVLDVYDLQDWQGTDIYKKSSALLYKSYANALNGLKFQEKDFDINEWAKYFALIDLFGTYHAAVPKSVKVYFNPEIDKFQPILFDAHQGAGRLNNFILLDLLNQNELYECEWICSYIEFFDGFFANEEFIDQYLKYLDIYSTDFFIKSVRETYNLRFRYLDNEFYSRLSQSDAVSAPGLSLYFFKFNKLLDRQKLVQKKLIIYKELNEL